MKKVIPLALFSVFFLSSCHSLTAPTTWEYIDMDFDLTPCESVEIVYEDKKVKETYIVTDWDEICLTYDQLVILEYNPDKEDIENPKLDYSKEVLSYSFVGCDFSLTLIPDYYIFGDGTIKNYKGASFYFEDLIESVRVYKATYLVSSEDK